MGKRSIKRVKAKESERIKSPPERQSINYDKEKPIFSFYNIVDSHCITVCQDDEKKSFINKLVELSNLTWKQIKFAPKHGLGFEKIRKDQLKVPIPTNISDDVTFLALRYHEKKPMVGYRTQATFHIIWFDSTFSLYDHGS